jgi:cytochrome c biogenesis protein CcmG/thiol:disulfide interchange protein DsbE
MFFILLTNDETYPGADYNSFELPPFRLDNLANSDLITKDTLEGNFILNVWASWCITCRIEHPYLMNLNNNGIPIIGLNYKDERDDAINWLNKYGNPYNLTVHDFKGTLALDLGVTGAPETFLVHNGKVVVHYQGEVNKLIWEDVFLPVIKEREIF